MSCGPSRHWQRPRRKCCHRRRASGCSFRRWCNSCNCSADKAWIRACLRAHRQRVGLPEILKPGEVNGDAKLRHLHVSQGLPRATGAAMRLSGRKLRTGWLRCIQRPSASARGRRAMSARRPAASPTCRWQRRPIRFHHPHQLCHTPLHGSGTKAITSAMTAASNFGIAERKVLRITNLEVGPCATPDRLRA